MIHWRRTVQIVSGRQAEAIARVHEWVEALKESTGMDSHFSFVTTGILGRACHSADFESMGAFEAADAKLHASPKGQALGAKHGQEERDGTLPFVSSTFHDEFWRYS